MTRTRSEFLLFIGWAVAVTCAFSEHTDQYEGPTRIAVIGGGIGGCSSAHFLRNKLNEHGAEIFVFERNDYLGGRVNHIEYQGLLLEVGGSIVHECNRHFKDFMALFGLEKESPLEGLLGIWNGNEFVFTESEWSLITLAKILYRYSTSPFQVRSLAEGVKDQFLQLYDVLPTKSFERVIDLFATVGLANLTTTQIRTALREQGINDIFINEMVAAITRVNYGQDVTISSLAGYVSLIGSGSDLYGVKGGNRQVVDRLCHHAGAFVQKNTRVTSIEFRNGEYVVRSRKNAPDSVEVDQTFDAVVIAAPLEFANISLGFLPLATDKEPIPTNIVRDRPYQRTCVTVAAGKLNPSFFGLQSEDQLPQVILTTESPSLPFSSIAAKRRLSDQQLVYKIFSRQPLPEEYLDKLFLSRTKPTFRHEWNAYPVLDPVVSVATQMPPIKLHDRIWYVNALESAVSTIETEIIAATNVVNLLVRSLAP